MASTEEKIALIGKLNEELKNRGMDPVIVVGGSAAEFWTLGRLYKSEDIDVTFLSIVPDKERETTMDILKQWGFEGFGRTYHHSELGITIDVLGSLENASKEKIRKMVFQGKDVLLIGIEDLILDRLRSCIYWNWNADCEIARGLVIIFKNTLDVDYLMLKAEPQIKEAITLLLQSVGDA